MRTSSSLLLLTLAFVLIVCCVPGNDVAIIPACQLTTKTIQSGDHDFVVKFTYAASGKLSEYQVGQAPGVRYEYDEQGRVSSAYLADNIKEVCTYKTDTIFADRYNLTQDKWSLEGSTVVYLNANGTIKAIVNLNRIDSTAYTYDERNNPVKVVNFIKGAVNSTRTVAYSNLTNPEATMPAFGSDTFSFDPLKQSPNLPAAYSVQKKYETTSAFMIYTANRFDYPDQVRTSITAGGVSHTNTTLYSYSMCK